MKQNRPFFAAAIGSLLLVPSHAHAQKHAYTKPPIVLTETGKELESKYATMQNALKAEFEKALPKLDEAKIAAWQQAILAEEGPAKEAAAKAAAVAKLQGAEENLRKLEENLKYGPQTLEDAQADLARARARGEEDPEKANALANSERFLASRQQEVAKLKVDIEKAKTAIEQAKAALPEAIKAAELATQAHQKAVSATWQAMDALGADPILNTKSLDGKLARYMVLSSGTATGLADFAQKSPENAKLIDQLLANEPLMLQMLVADGPVDGKFGEAMKIYTDIQKASPKAKEGVFQRLAMAISLTHAVPVFKRNRPSSDLVKVTLEMAKDPSFFIDPLQRYLNYEKWYLAGELHKGFKDLSVWNLMRVVDCMDPDDALAWGRQMLHTLRSDCIPDDTDTLVFVNVVDKEIKYGSDEVKNDLPDLQVMQNILANGGICGRRGFFGRFMLQAFGVPSTERVEPGHSTIALWHPDGWVTRLGGRWGAGWMGLGARSYGADTHFLASSQAREDANAFMRVKRGQWIASLMGESPKPGLVTKNPKPTGKPGEIVKSTTWSDLALHEQRRIIAQLDAAKPKSSVTPVFAEKEPSATGKATVDAKGVITIPSAACSSPTESKRSLFRGGQADLIVFVNNKAGETLLHLSRYAKSVDSFEYTFDAPKAGTYQLVADLAVPKPNQKLFATANGGTAVEMALPYTIGLWGKSSPVEVELKAGSNILKFHGPARATFKQFTLTPKN
jgi:hypothetical protein